MNMKYQPKQKYGMRRAAILQFISKYANIAIQLIVTAILARLISPNDFGLLSIVTVFTAFFQLFSDMGIGTAIVQYRDLTEEDYGKLFVFSTILAIVLVVLFCVMAIPISWFYDDSRLIPLCHATAPALILNTLNMVPNGLMLKDKRFGAIALRLVTSTLVSGIVAIILATMGAGCYALAVQTVLSALIILIWNLATRPIRYFSIHFTAPLKHVFSYSAYQFGFSFINYFSRNLDNLVIGRVMGTASLGYYDKAYKLTTYPMSSISSVAASVIQPYMAENQSNPERILQCWYKVTKLLSLVGAFIAAVFVTAAPEIITFFYGPQWEPSIPLFQALSVTIYFQMIGNPSGAFFQSLGRTDLMFRQGLICTVLTVLGLIVGSATHSLRLLAICISAAFCLHIIPIIYYLLVKGMHAPMRILLRFTPEIAVGISSVVINTFIFKIYPLPPAFSLLAKLMLAVFIFMIGYMISGNMKYILSIFK